MRRRDEDGTCEETEVGGRALATPASGIGEHRVVVYDPAGPGGRPRHEPEGSIEGYALDDLVAPASSLPAPVCDPAEYGRD